MTESSVRVVFFGNHTVGVKTLEALSEMEQVAGIVAHPPDKEDGVRYLSVFDFAAKQGWNVIRSTSKNERLEEFVRNCRPDLIWVTDYRYLLPEKILSIPPLGAINLHPSLLPRYRGRASINWAILNGETTLGLTAHFIDEGMDTGDIIAQAQYILGEEDDVGDALEILYPLYGEITTKVLSLFRRGPLPRTPQDHSRATLFPSRKPEDGLIDWNRPARDVLNLIRAVAFPYPGAFTFLEGRKLLVWKAHLLSRSTREPGGGVPGEIVKVESGEALVQCMDGPIVVSRFEVQDKQLDKDLEPGIILGARALGCQ